MISAPSVIGNTRITAGGPYTDTELVNTKRRTRWALLAASSRPVPVTFASTVRTSARSVGSASPAPSPFFHHSLRSAGRVAILRPLPRKVEHHVDALGGMHERALVVQLPRHDLEARMSAQLG